MAQCRVRLLLLPGMDGGARLLAPFAAHLPAWIAPEIVAYPSDARLGYAELEQHVRARVEGSPAPVALLAESFSGPIGIRIAADPPPGLRALVLVATFAVGPRPAWLAALAGSWLFLARPPAFLLRRTLLGADASDALVREVREAIGQAPARVLSARARDALRVDVRAELRRIAVPVVHVAGTRDRVIGDPRALARWRAGLRTESIDAPHLVLQHAPERAASVVARFLSSLPERGAG